jgi:hypothetical protein
MDDLDALLAARANAGTAKPYAYSEGPLTPEDQAKYANAPRIVTAGAGAPSGGTSAAQNVDPIDAMLASKANGSSNSLDAGSTAANYSSLPPQMTQQANIDPTAGMSGLEKFGAGMGKAFYDVGRGVGAIVTDAVPSAEKFGFATRKDIDEARKLDAPLMNTGAGTAGNVAGNIAAFAPTAMIPGANTIAGGAAIGALTGALQPVGANDSRLSNIGGGAVLGGSIPALVRALKVGKAALVDPFTESGRSRIVGATLNRAAADPEQAIANLNAAAGNTPGFMPTAGQAANDAGIASMERAARAIDPAGFGDVDNSQRAALVNALRGIAKTPEDRAIAVSARDSAVEPLYTAAKQATVSGDADLDSLLTRPSMKAAQSRAAALAAERNQPFQLSQATPSQAIDTGLLDASGKPIVNTAQAVPATYSGQSLHDLKMGLSDAIGSPVNGIQGAERAAAIGTQNQFLNWLENKIPEYGVARQTFADMSRPINQMDIGQELYNRFVPALADSAVPFKTRADALAQALRNGDQLAKNVTGLKNATMTGIMEPEQMNLLNGVVKDAQMRAAAESAGRGVGSDTVQKMAMSNLLAESGLPSWIQNVARVPGGWLKTVGNILYGKNDESMRHLLADVLKDPQAAASVMQKAGVAPSKIADYLRMGAQGTALSLPAVMNAHQ